MNEKSIKEALKNIARRRTAHHTDLWSGIEAQIRTTKPRRKMPMRWATVFAAGCIALLFVSAGVYAMRHLSIFTPDFDPGLEQAHEDQLGIELAESQTIDGVTAALDWVYGDQHRVAVYYSLTQPDAPYYLVGMNPVVNLRLADGLTLPPIFGGGGGGSGGGGGGGSGSGNVPTEDPRVSWEASGSMNFDTTSITDNPSELHLQLELRLLLQVEPIGQASAMPEAREIGPFYFDFAVPFIPATVIDTQIGQRASDITVTLEEISITPSSSLLTLCMDGLASDLTWLPEAQLDTGREVVPDIGFIGIAPKTYQLGERSCAVIDFLIPYRGGSEEWTLTVDSLHSVSPDGSAHAEDMMPQIDGPWIFSIPVEVDAEAFDQ